MKIPTLIGIALWALIPGFIAKKKYRSFWGYYFLSFLISPLITMIIALCVSDKICEYYAENPMPYRPKPDRQEVSSTGSSSSFPPPGISVLYCRKCGKKLPDNSRFCHKCGTAVEIVDAPSVSKKEAPTVWVCEKCKTKNLSTRNDCWSCGASK